jgi:hypothetical protein
MCRAIGEILITGTGTRPAPLFLGIASGGMPLAISGRSSMPSSRGSTAGRRTRRTDCTRSGAEHPALQRVFLVGWPDRPALVCRS